MCIRDRIGAVLLWIICGPIALGFLLVAGRNLPAADYGTIAYWEVPVTLMTWSVAGMSWRCPSAVV